jgi:cobalamin synthase
VSEKKAMQRIVVAFEFLTFGIHHRGVRITPEQAGDAAVYFPLVGFGLGFVLNVVNRVMEPHLGSEVLSVVLVATSVIMTAALHLRGLQKTFDAFAARPNVAGRTSPSLGIHGVMAILFVVLFKVRSVEVIGETLGVSLLLAPALARWGLVMFLYGSTSTLDDIASIVTRQVKTWHMLVTSAATLAVAFFLAGRTALWIGLCVSLVALLGRYFLCRRHGGISYDNFGALIEMSEALTFLLFASV